MQKKRHPKGNKANKYHSGYKPKCDNLLILKTKYQKLVAIVAAYCDCMASIYRDQRFSNEKKKQLTNKTDHVIRILKEIDVLRIKPFYPKKFAELKSSLENLILEAEKDGVFNPTGYNYTINETSETIRDCRTCVGTCRTQNAHGKLVYKPEQYSNKRNCQLWKPHHQECTYCRYFIVHNINTTESRESDGLCFKSTTVNGKPVMDYYHENDSRIDQKIEMKQTNYDSWCSNWELDAIYTKSATIDLIKNHLEFLEKLVDANSESIDSESSDSDNSD